MKLFKRKNRNKGKDKKYITVKRGDDVRHYPEAGATLNMTLERVRDIEK